MISTIVCAAGFSRSRGFALGLVLTALMLSSPVAGAAQSPPRHHTGNHHLHHRGVFMAAIPAEIGIPESMRLEHEELHNELLGATKAPGRIGEAARAVAKVLHPHFVREEQIALPPLGLLRALGEGQFAAEMLDVLPLTDALRAELPRMLEEHKAIGAALRRLGEVAAEENAPEFERLAGKIRLHAQSEEEVFYPAALLVGEIVRIRAGRGPRE